MLGDWDDLVIGERLDLEVGGLTFSGPVTFLHRRQCRTISFTIFEDDLLEAMDFDAATTHRPRTSEPLN